LTAECAAACGEQLCFPESKLGEYAPLLPDLLFEDGDYTVILDSCQHGPKAGAILIGSGEGFKLYKKGEDLPLERGPETGVERAMFEQARREGMFETIRAAWLYGFLLGVWVCF